MSHLTRENNSIYFIHRKNVLNKFLALLTGIRLYSFGNSVINLYISFGPFSYIMPYYFVVKLDGPGQGLRSRSRPGLTSRDFRDSGVCLRHYTAD